MKADFVKIQANISLPLVGFCILAICCNLSCKSGKKADTLPEGNFVKVEPGIFRMGAELLENVVERGPQRIGPHWDEAPVHEVRISRSYDLGVSKVTQAEFARFKPGHKGYMKSRGLYWQPDAPAVMVTWDEAMEYCRWLGEQENSTIRLPTEAEWEYAARNAETLGLKQISDGIMEWCMDWWAPYDADAVKDPLGPEKGDVRVTRNGDWFALYGPVIEARSGYEYYNPEGPENGIKRSEYWWTLYGPDDPSDPRARVFNRDRYVLKSRVTDRSGTMPGDRRANLGFRVVRGRMPRGVYRTPPPTPRVFSEVSQERIEWKEQDHPDEPLFFTNLHIIPPEGQSERRALPYFNRHHVPSLVWCDNGDLLLLCFSAPADYSDQMVYLVTRMRYGTDQWDPPARFFVIPDRNIDLGVLHKHGIGEIHQYIPLKGSLKYEGGWYGGAGHAISALKRVSRDNGATWSAPRIVSEYPPVQASNANFKGEPSLSPFMKIVRMDDGSLVMPCDVKSNEKIPLHEEKLHGSVMFISSDDGESWEEMTRYGWNPQGFARAGDSAGWIAGVHNPPIPISGGRWLSFGRYDDIDGRAPMSLSEDGGRTWTYRASPFSPIAESQKQVMIRLAEGPILLVWFTDPVVRVRKRRGWQEKGMDFVDIDGKTHKGYGMFATLSFDEGETWPVRKLIPDDPAQPWEARHDGGVNMDVVQAPDGIIHLASSSRYYRFNLAWLMAPMPGPQ